MQFTWVFKTTLTEESSPELGDGDFWRCQESLVLSSSDYNVRCLLSCSLEG